MSSFAVVLMTPMLPNNKPSKATLPVPRMTTSLVGFRLCGVVIRGTGNLAFDGLLFGNIGVINTTAFNFILNGPNIAAIAAGNVNPLLRDLEMPTNVLAERMKYRVSTNALGAWFSLRTLTPSIKSDPFSPVRGTN